jgi:hypothetical protein
LLVRHRGLVAGDNGGLKGLQLTEVDAPRVDLDEAFGLLPHLRAIDDQAGHFFDVAALLGCCHTMLATDDGRISS